MTTNTTPAPAHAARPAGTWTVDYSETLCAWVVTPDTRVTLTVVGVLYRVIEVLLPQTNTPVMIGLVRQTKTGRDYARGGSLVLEYADDARDVPADVAEVIEYAERCARPVYDAPAAIADRAALDVARSEAATRDAGIRVSDIVTGERGTGTVVSTIGGEPLIDWRDGNQTRVPADTVRVVGRDHGDHFTWITPTDDAAPVSDAVMGEARGWLADCGLSVPADDAVVISRVAREYDGGWSGFVADVAPAMDAPVAPAETADDAPVCAAHWQNGLTCERTDRHADDDHRTRLFGRPVTFTRATGESAPAVTTGRRSAERTTFLADVLCAALEGGIGYWSAAGDIVRVSDAGEVIGWRYDAVTLWEGADGDDDCSVADGPCQGHRVTLDTVASAVSRISKTRRDECPGAGGFAYRYVQAVRDASMENDAGEVDADVADIVVQVAALGSVVYG